MANLTAEMKEFLNGNLAWVATIGKDGHVDLGPKMSMFIIDDNHIGYHERTAGQMYRNLLDGSELVVAVANLEQRKGYQGRTARQRRELRGTGQNRRGTRHEEAHDHAGVADHGNPESDTGSDGRKDHRQGLTIMVGSPNPYGMVDRWTRSDMAD